MPLGFKHSPETRAKISAANKGRKNPPPSPETRAKISAAGKGRKCSPETLARMSAAQKGHAVSWEARAKISATKSVHGLSYTEHYLRYRQYGLTPEQFETILAEQDNRCAVCRHEFTDANPPVVDHDHNCCPGKKTCGQCIGGLLHGKCNIGVGLLGDDPETCLMAAIYLRTRRKRFAGNLQATPSIAKFYDAFLNIPSHSAEPITATVQ